MWNRQTIEQLAERTGKSHVWVKKQLDIAQGIERDLTPQTTSIAADMTFWGRGYGVIVFRSPTLKENLCWAESLFETPWVYKEGLEHLLKKGWNITSAVIDGKCGVAQVFESAGIPVQYCQFHQIKTITNYLTRKPQTDAGRELRSLALTLTRTNEKTFRKELADWHAKHELFLNEKSPALHTKRGWTYTHRRMRSAYRSLTSNLSRLFIYQKYPELNIPNTTNCLDGMFSQLKNRLAVHRGLRRDRRFKVISEILRGKRN
ncbi:MAG: hypothetical protein KAS07_02640 [Candidatus Pacebacteria bacterium]|nr:hypothetical protein [Candidatus Paceibacterota bacterium]